MKKTLYKRIKLPKPPKKRKPKYLDLVIVLCFIVGIYFSAYITWMNFNLFGIVYYALLKVGELSLYKFLIIQMFNVILWIFILYSIMVKLVLRRGKE